MSEQNEKDLGNNLVLKGANYIGGIPSKEGEDTFTSINPKNGEKSSVSYHEATKAEIGKACDLAYEAFKELRKKTDEEIAEFLTMVSAEIMNLGEQLLTTADWETALGLQRLTGERGRTCTQINMFANYIKNKKHEDDIVDKEPDLELKRTQLPIGPVGVFGASNFPLAFGVCGGDTASALAAGCPVVAKAHPSHPQTAELFAIAVSRAVIDAGFPKGTFSLIHGTKNIIGKNLVLHPHIQAIGFTGSLGGGRALFDLASSRHDPIPVYAEMGSINPVFVTENAIEKRAEQMAKMFADSITLGVGQFCTKPGIFFIPKSEKSTDFIGEVVKYIKEKPELPLLNENIHHSLVEMTDETIKQVEEVNILTGGNASKNHYAYQNTILETEIPDDLDKFFEKERLLMEHFGPIALFVQVPDSIAYEDIAEKLEGQLTGTIHLEKEDHENMKSLVEELSQKVGRLIVDGVPTGVKVSPAMHHGGPYPATTASRTTSVGMTAIRRFLKPICYQNVPEALLPT